jgi:hypothetical protein
MEVGVWIVAFGGTNFPVPATRPSTSQVSSYLARGDRLQTAFLCHESEAVPRRAELVTTN